MADVKIAHTCTYTDDILLIVEGRSSGIGGVITKLRVVFVEVGFFGTGYERVGLLLSMVKVARRESARLSSSVH